MVDIPFIIMAVFLGSSPSDPQIHKWALFAIEKILAGNMCADRYAAICFNPYIGDWVMFGFTWINMSWPTHV